MASEAASSPLTESEVLAATVRVPEHVVFREFAQETVLLDVESGRYYGLNLTAGRMLATLQAAATVQEAVRALAEEFPDAGESLGTDVRTLCLELRKRGLLAITPQ